MRNFVTALVALAALALASSAHAQAANDTTLTWNITGSVCRVPGQPGCKDFECTVTGTSTNCVSGISQLTMSFAGASASTFGLTFGISRPCTASSCTPLAAATDAQPAAATATFSAGVFTASQGPINAYFPPGCSMCFSGLTPLFTIQWAASTSGVVPTTTTTTTTTSTT